jgi:hypothetical protein
VDIAREHIAALLTLIIASERFGFAVSLGVGAAALPLASE